MSQYERGDIRIRLLLASTLDERLCCLRLRLQEADSSTCFPSLLLKSSSFLLEFFQRQFKPTGRSCCHLSGPFAQPDQKIHALHVDGIVHDSRIGHRVVVDEPAVQDTLSSREWEQLAKSILGPTHDPVLFHGHPPLQSDLVLYTKQ